MPKSHKLSSDFMEDFTTNNFEILGHQIIGEMDVDTLHK